MSNDLGMDNSAVGASVEEKRSYKATSDGLLDTSLAYYMNAGGQFDMGVNRGATQTPQFDSLPMPTQTTNEEANGDCTSLMQTYCPTQTRGGNLNAVSPPPDAAGSQTKDAGKYLSDRSAGAPLSSEMYGGTYFSPTLSAAAPVYGSHMQSSGEATPNMTYSPGYGSVQRYSQLGTNSAGAYAGDSGLHCYDTCNTYNSSGAVTAPQTKMATNNLQSAQLLLQHYGYGDTSACGNFQSGQNYSTLPSYGTDDPVQNHNTLPSYNTYSSAMTTPHTAVATNHPQASTYQALLQSYGDTSAYGDTSPSYGVDQQTLAYWYYYNLYLMNYLNGLGQNNNYG